VVIDTGNYYPVRDGRIAAIEEGQLESEWVAERLARPVVKSVLPAAPMTRTAFASYASVAV
jgi:hypothetical protein